MPEMSPVVKVAVVQAAPVLFDREATIEKACRLTAEAAAQGARLILFPEAFIPAYPRGLSFGSVVGGRTSEGRRAWQAYWANAVDVPGRATEALGATAREAHAYLAIGVIERDSEFSRGTLYCTLLYFDPDGRLLGKHRKLKPTAGERLIWGEGDGSTLTAVKTEFGKVGGLICWENYMPLARMAMYSKGVDIYLAPTADARDTWQATLRHIACEGRCFVLGCNQFVTKSMYPAELPGVEDLAAQPEVMCRGGSAILSPLGAVIAGPLYDQEGILLAELDLGEIPRSRLDFDVAGHYARPDVFRLTVNEQPAPAGRLFHRGIMLIDAHAHLDRYPNELLVAVLEEIRARGILTISTAMDLPSYERAQEIATRSGFVLPTFGIHPWNAPAHVHRLKDLEGAIERSPILGEIGLDQRFVEESAQYPAQRTVFEFFLAAARDQGKIVNLHTSGAEAEVLALLARYGIRRAIVHWYAGPTEILRALADQGAFFTMGVEVLFSPRIQTIAREIPADRLLTETDNPDGLEWLTGALGMPDALVAVVEKLAEIRGLTPDLLTRTVGENFMRLIRDDAWLSDLRASLLEHTGFPESRTSGSEFRESAPALRNATGTREGACE